MAKKDDKTNGGTPKKRSVKSTDGSGKQRKLANMAPPWEKGQSGNPNGRPKKEESLTGLMREIMDEKYPNPDKIKGKVTFKYAWCKALILQGMKGNASAIREVLERMDGKVALPITGIGDRPIHIILTDRTE